VHTGVCFSRTEETQLLLLVWRYEERMSRPKIQELLFDWVDVSLCVGTIDQCILQVGIACTPVVEELIEELQAADVIQQK